MAIRKDDNGGDTLIFTCAGATHSGYVASAAGVQLHRERAGSLFCTTALAAEVPAKLEQARRAKRRIVIDGCDENCCQKLMLKAKVPVELHVLVTDLGIDKAPHRPDPATDTQRVVAHVLTELKGGRV